MKREIVRFITDALGKENFRLLVFEGEDQVIEGALVGKDGFWYPITRGVPCFLR